MSLFRKIILTILLLAAAGFVLEYYRTWKMEKNDRKEEVHIDNPTDQVIELRIDEDSIELPPHCYITHYKLRHQEHHISAAILNGEKICDTIYSNNARTFFLNPTRSQYVYWTVRYKQNDSVISESDSLFQNTHVINGGKFKGNLKIFNGLIQEDDVALFRSTEIDPKRTYASPSGVSDFEYFFRTNDFIAVYRNSIATIFADALKMVSNDSLKKPLSEMEIISYAEEPSGFLNSDTRLYINLKSFYDLKKKTYHTITYSSDGTIEKETYTSFPPIYFPDCSHF